MLGLEALCSCLYSSNPPPPKGLALFILALVAISSPSTTNLCLQKQLALFPVTLDAQPAWEVCRPIWQVVSLNKELGGCFSYSTPASEILWWGQGKVPFDASLTKGRHCCFYPYAINYCLLPAHPLHHISRKSLHSAPAPGKHRPGNCGFPCYSLMSFSLLHPT